MDINTLYILYPLLLIINLVFSGYPISDPYASSIGGKIEPYNLIDTDPSCFHQGICNMFPPGGKLSAFPNSEEKFQQMLHNVHRMFANQSLGTDLGKWFYGGNEFGGATYFCKRGCVYCGTTHPDRRPLHWYSDANQMARFKQWDENTCDQSWYNEPGENAHSTCKWANTSLPKWRGFTNGILTTTYKGNTYKTGTDRCSIFGHTANPSSSPTNPTPFSSECDFAARGGKFCHDDKDRCWFETEGICGGNTCLFDPHCEPIFANKYDYAGKGFVAHMNGVGAVYSRYTKEIYYTLPIGVHYDERYKIVPQDRASDTGKYFVLMVEYFDYNKTQTPTNCYALYDGTYTSMDVYLSNHPYDGGEYKKGWYDNNDYSVIFKSNFLPPSFPGCQPYSFLCKTSLGNFFRLPEENKYYFGTEWIDWVWSNYEADFGYKCDENHYYDHNTEGWTVNGGPTLTKSDIWYYQDTLQHGTCIGCDYIAKLQCWEQCILSNFNDADCKCSGSHSPTTKIPTSSPTTPTKIPSISPIIPTAPTAATTRIPTSPPSISTTPSPTAPTKTPSVSPIIPTAATTPIPTSSPSISTTISLTTSTNIPTTSTTVINIDTQSPTPSPTDIPSRSPLVSGQTHSPSISPTISPTIIQIQEAEEGKQEGIGSTIIVLAAGGILGLVCILCMLAVYRRSKTGKPSSKLSQTEPQMMQQITEDNMRLQIQHATGPSGVVEYDIDATAAVPMRPPPPPPDAVKGLPPPFVTDDEYENDNIGNLETSPLSQDDGNKVVTNYEYDLDI